MNAPDAGLLERESELAVIHSWLRAAAAAEAAPLIIEGEAGAGKTALLEEAARRGVGLGMQVLRARGGEYEREFPYGVVRQLFEPVLARDGGRAGLAGSAAMAAPAFDGSGAEDAFSIQHGLYWLAAEIAEEAPLLIAVDDAQWVDDPSLQALLYIARRLGEMRTGLALTVRSGTADRPHAIDGLRSEPGAQLLWPASLSTAAIAAMAVRGGGGASEEFVHACREATGGNPFLVAELLRVLTEREVDLSEVEVDELAAIAASGASGAILARLARLGKAESEVARAVAILEPHAEVRLVAEMIGLKAPRVAAAGAKLVSASLFTDGPRLGFAHPLVREAVLEEMGERGRRSAHSRAARLHDEDGADLDTVAAHLLLADPLGDDWALAKLREAAASAVGRGAPSAAVRYLRRALAEPPPPGDRLAVKKELGLALLRGDDSGGIEVLLDVHARARTREERAEMAAVLSNAMMFRGHHSEGEAILHDALADSPGLEDEAGLHLHLHLLLATLTGFEGLPERYLLEPHTPVPDSPEGRAILSQSSLLYSLGLGNMPTAVEFAGRIDSDPERAEADARAGWPGNPHLLALALADRPEGIYERFEYHLAGARLRGGLGGVANVYGTRAYCRFLDGELSEAQADAETAMRLSGEMGFRVQLLTWLGVLAPVMAARGEAAAAAVLVDRHLGTYPSSPGLAAAVALIGRGYVRQALSRHAEAAEDFRAAGERLGWIRLANPEAIGWRPLLVVSLAAIGEREEAERLAGECVELAIEAEGTRGIGVALRARGLVGGEMSAIENLRHSAEVLGGTKARLQHAETLVELGAALRRGNCRREARDPLAQGLELAHRCGAITLEQRARIELAATGARPRNVVRSGIEALTPSELRVARMAAEGMTNREIAQALVVSLKTVETHMRHVFQKLDLARRTEIADVLGVP